MHSVYVSMKNDITFLVSGFRLWMFFFFKAGVGVGNPQYGFFIFIFFTLKFIIKDLKFIVLIVNLIREI